MVKIELEDEFFQLRNSKDLRKDIAFVREGEEVRFSTAGVCTGWQNSRFVWIPRLNAPTILLL